MKTRIISAFIALTILFSLCYFFEERGLIVLSSLVVLGSIFEFSRLSFESTHPPQYLIVVFFILCCLIYISNLLGASSSLILALASCLFLALSIVRIETKSSLIVMAKTQYSALVGFVYVALFPSWVVKTLLFEHGMTWFLFLLSIVFAGDSMALIVGKYKGSKKLLEAVSPKKTVEGALGGLLGSSLAAIVFWIFWLRTYSLPELMLISILTGIFAQIGDLFESLLKRIANVKDSGGIMPGHGGLLDRVDGVYFAGPIFYVLLELLLKIDFS